MITNADLKFQKSAVVGDVSGTNGGFMAVNDSPVGNSLFQNVTSSERDAGIIRYRKAFLKNENASEDVLGNARAYVKTISPAEDVFLIKEALAQDEVQSAAEAFTDWNGAGILNADVLAGVGQIDVDSEAGNLLGFYGPSTIILWHADENGLETLEVISVTSVIGWAGSVVTLNLTGSLNNNFERAWFSGVCDDVGANTIGTSASFTPTHQVNRYIRMLDGPAAGHTRRVVSNDSDLLTLQYPWIVGSEPVVGNSYEIIKTHVCTLAELGDVGASYDTLAGTATYDDTDPIKTFPIGTIDDDWVITFGGDGLAYTVSSVRLGAVSSGTLDGNTDPIKPAHGGSFYFEMPYAGFSAPYVGGEQITFSTYSSAKGFWAKETVTAGAEAHGGNRWRIGALGETV